MEKIRKSNAKNRLFLKSSLVFISASFAFGLAGRIGLNKWSGLFAPQSWDEIFSNWPTILLASSFMALIYSIMNRNK